MLYAIKMSDKETNGCDASSNRYLKPWQKLADAYHKMSIARANSKGRLLAQEDSITYLVLGLSAATGKFVNEAKKCFRGDSDNSPAKMKDYLSAVRIYTEQLALELNFDLDNACDKHMCEVLNRIDVK